MPYKDKCFSSCRGFEKNECNPPRCKYIIGQTLKYCRLSNKYKMKKPKCNVTRKIKKGEIKQNAITKINETIKKSQLFIKTICPESGVCISFGKNNKEITNYFNGFTDFKYAIYPIKRIGGESANGFIKEISYEKHGYKADAILKSSQSYKADNLVYEYLVGTKYINRIMNRFPCFLQTYGFYYYKDETHWEKMRDSSYIFNKLTISDLILQNSVDYPKSCVNSKHASILIQHIKSAKTIGDIILGYNCNKFIINDLLFVLFIIYQALSSISKTFTHYDLHTHNVLLYEPCKGKYIQYHYFDNTNTELLFRSPYIPKIIDYGRSFFDNGNLNSRTIYNKVCNTSQCDPNCGYKYGYSWLSPNNNSTIVSSIKNESHDLRLLKILYDKLKNKVFGIVNKPTAHTSLYKILKMVKYGVGEKGDNKKYGTIENLKNTNLHINNVSGAFIELKKALNNQTIINDNISNYSNISDKLGDLYIYQDGRPMKYEK